MIAALSLTLYLSCGMPERMLADDGAGWVKSFELTPIINEIRGESIDYGYIVRADHGDKGKVTAIYNSLVAEGHEIEIKDTCTT
jgi:hypothetical protein